MFAFRVNYFCTDEFLLGMLLLLLMMGIVKQGGVEGGAGWAHGGDGLPPVNLLIYPAAVMLEHRVGAVQPVRNTVGGKGCTARRCVLPFSASCNFLVASRNNELILKI